MSELESVYYFNGDPELLIMALEAGLSPDQISHISHGDSVEITPNRIKGIEGNSGFKRAKLTKLGTQLLRIATNKPR